MTQSLFLYRHAEAVMQIIGTRTTTMCDLGDVSGAVIGRIMRHPQAPEATAVVLDDNRAGAGALGLIAATQRAANR